MGRTEALSGSVGTIVTGIGPVTGQVVEVGDVVAVARGTRVAEVDPIGAIVSVGTGVQAW